MPISTAPFAPMISPCLVNLWCDILETIFFVFLCILCLPLEQGPFSCAYELLGFPKNIIKRKCAQQNPTLWKPCWFSTLPSSCCRLELACASSCEAQAPPNVAAISTDLQRVASQPNALSACPNCKLTLVDSASEKNKKILRYEHV